MNSNTWLELLRHYVRWLCTESHRDVPLDVQWSGQAFRPLRYWTSCSSPLHMVDERICSSSLTVLAFHPKTPLVFVVFFNPHNFWDQKCAPPHPLLFPRDIITEGYHPASLILSCTYFFPSLAAGRKAAQFTIFSSEMVETRAPSLARRRAVVMAAAVDLIGVAGVAAA